MWSNNILPLILLFGKERNGEGNGSLLQYSCLENSVDRGVWWATVHGVAQSQTRLGEHKQSVIKSPWFCSVSKLYLSLCHPMAATCQASLSFTVSGVCLNSCPLSQCCYLIISSSDTPFLF